ncbi:hypothetical protein BCM02_1053 [Paenibacillus methanolicus]|uniref:Uncharacterized protein n=1 Tax=Paenibacillus methanolicus TaxID=582686 RepID=A0A5S5C5L6_9BACL|nr:hypothetical protein BCM02_1053 [Paenibacillus methanolicus]
MGDAKFKVLFQCNLEVNLYKQFNHECYYAEVLEVDEKTLSLIFTDSYPLNCKVCGYGPVSTRLLNEDIDLSLLFEKWNSDPDWWS